MSATTACRFCPLGPSTLSSTGLHLDILLPAFRKHRKNTTSEARGTNKHPLPIILYARSKVEGGRRIAWDLPHYTPAEDRVIEAFAAHVIISNVHKQINTFHGRCPPEWWMDHMKRIMNLYTLDHDYEAMMSAVEDVMHDADRRMNEFEHRPTVVEHPQRIMIGNKMQGSLRRGDLNAPVAGGDLSTVETSNKGTIHGNVVANDKAMKDEFQDESDYGLPLPRRRGRRAAPRKADIISLLSSSPVRAPVKMPKHKEKVARQNEIPVVIFTLTVNVIGAEYIIPVTFEMTLTDTIAAAVSGSLLKGSDPTGFVIAGADGGIWDSQKWNEVWVEAAHGKVRAWSVELRAEKK